MIDPTLLLVIQLLYGVIALVSLLCIFSGTLKDDESFPLPIAIMLCTLVASLWPIVAAVIFVRWLICFANTGVFK